MIHLILYFWNTFEYPFISQGAVSPIGNALPPTQMITGNARPQVVIRLEPQNRQQPTQLQNLDLSIQNHFYNGRDVAHTDFRIRVSLADQGITNEEPVRESEIRQRTANSTFTEE